MLAPAFVMLESRNLPCSSGSSSSSFSSSGCSLAFNLSAILVEFANLDSTDLCFLSAASSASPAASLASILFRLFDRFSFFSGARSGDDGGGGEAFFGVTGEEAVVAFGGT